MQDGNSDFPKIGDFSGLKDNSSRLPRKEPEQVSDEEKAEATAKANLDDIMKPLTPEELAAEYEKGLIEIGMTIIQARAIMEMIFIKGYYEETPKLGPTKVTIRTRSYSDTVRAQRFLEVENPSYQMSVQDMLARYNVAASLVAYAVGDPEHEVRFSFPEDEKAQGEEFQRRLNFIMNKPSIVVAKLMQLVHDFDVKVARVFADGAPQDF